MESGCEEVYQLAKMGRPKIENPRTWKVSVRFSDDDYQTLKNYAAAHDLTMTQVLLEGLKLMYQAEEGNHAKSLS